MNLCFAMNSQAFRLIFKRRPSTRHMCAQEAHTYNNRIEVSKQCLYKVKNILILTVTTIGVRGTIAKLLLGLHSSQGRLTRGSVCQALLTKLGETPLYLCPSSEQHFTTHWGVGGIARVSPCRTQQV